MLQLIEPSKVPYTDIMPDPNQPRKSFNADELEAMAKTIRDIGLIQPIILRDCDPAEWALIVEDKKSDRTDPPKYLIVAGERRFKACILAGLEEIPAIREPKRDPDGLAALVENLQRKDLNAIDTANALRLQVERSGSAKALAAKIGLAETDISHHLRLLKLPEHVQAMIQAEKISYGQARVIAGAKKDLLTKLVNMALKGESVRKLEAAKRGKKDAKKKSGGNGDGKEEEEGDEGQANPVEGEKRELYKLGEIVGMRVFGVIKKGSPYMGFQADNEKTLKAMITKFAVAMRVLAKDGELGDFTPPTGPLANVKPKKNGNGK